MATTLDSNEFPDDGHAEPSLHAVATAPGSEPAVDARERKRGGPRTPEGKKAVAQNAVTHGINSLSPVAGGESPEAWEAFRQGYHQSFAPVGVPEIETVDEMAMVKWRQRRVIRAETADIDALFDAIDDPNWQPELFDDSTPEEHDESQIPLMNALFVLGWLISPDGKPEPPVPDWWFIADEIADVNWPTLPRSETAWTKEIFIEYLTETAESLGTTYDQLIKDACEKEK